MYFFEPGILETVQVSRTSLERPIEDYRMARLFDSPQALGPAPFGLDI
jgi:hypothetical protein